MQVRSLGWEDPLEKEMATHSNILAWRIPWTEEPGRSMGLQIVRYERATKTFIFSKECTRCGIRIKEYNLKLKTKAGKSLSKGTSVLPQQCNSS